MFDPLHLRKFILDMGAETILELITKGTYVLISLILGLRSGKSGVVLETMPRIILKMTKNFPTLF